MSRKANSSYIKRHLESSLRLALTDTPVVCLLGPRQCGKSTLAAHLEPERHYISLDDANFLRLATSDPQGFIAELPEYVTIDEIQRVPELTLAIKRSVDMNRKPGRFLLTGSANLLQLPRLADSLAGRMECLYLHPFTESEKEGNSGDFLRAWMAGGIETRLSPSRPLKQSSLPQRLVAGGYPEAFKRVPNRARTWKEQYIQSIIERDIHDIAQVRDGKDIERFIEFLAHRTARLLNVTEAAKALGHTRATVDRYLSILERLFLIRCLPAWHKNSSKRLIKTPKLHFCDCGLAAAISGIADDMWMTERSRFGYLLESFVLQQLNTHASQIDPGIRVWHYRDKDQVEVDCVLTKWNQVWGVEVKAATVVNTSDGQGLRRLASVAGSHFQGGIILYDGTSILPISKESKLFAVPLSKLWEL